MNFRFNHFAIVLVCLLCIGCKGKVNEQEDPHKHTIEKSATEPLAMRTPFFEAAGPDWFLSISEESISFSSEHIGFETFNAPTTEAINAADANVKRYRSNPEKGKIDITITAKESDSVTHYEVGVSIQRGIDSVFTNFEGTGKYIMDYRLHDFWVLETLEGQTVSNDLFRDELPYLKINTEKKRFVGFGGCNQLRGELFAEHQLLRFINIAQTRMLCAPPNKEAQFVQALRSSTHFKMNQNELILSNPDGETLRFKKTD
jgi:heat shock protein HslJ